MKKILTLLFLFIAFATAVSAQNKPAATLFNIAAQGASPINNSEYNFGVGASGQFEIPASTFVNFTASLGYTSFTIKDIYKKLLVASGKSASAQGFIPVQVGVKYYIIPQFYSAVQVGAAVGIQNGASTAFTYSPGIGGVIPVGNGNAFDIGVRYEGWALDSPLNFIGLHLAYKFGL